MIFETKRERVVIASSDPTIRLSKIVIASFAAANLPDIEPREQITNAIIEQFNAMVQIYLQDSITLETNEDYCNDESDNFPGAENTNTDIASQIDSISKDLFEQLLGLIGDESQYSIDDIAIAIYQESNVITKLSSQSITFLNNTMESYITNNSHYKLFRLSTYLYLKYKLGIKVQ